jgi:hypothetical protein
VTVHDDTLIEEMVEKIALDGLSISGAAAAIAEKHGFDNTHDDATPQRLARKYRERFGRYVIRVCRDPDGIPWYSCGPEGFEHFMESRGLMDVEKLPPGWKKASTIYTHEKTELLAFLKQTLVLDSE